MNVYFDSAFEVKFQAETGQFEGYASVFDVVDSARDRMAPGAFKKSLQDAARLGRQPPLLWQHDAAQPIGAWREIFEDSHGLFVRGDLFVADIPRAKEAYKLMQEKVVNGLSIGYRVKQSQRDPKTGIRLLTEVELLEISMVTFPANDSARIVRVKSALAAGSLPSEREFEAFLRDAGFSRKQAKGLLADGYKSLQHDVVLRRDAGAENDAARPEVAAVRHLADTIRRLI